MRTRSGMKENETFELKKSLSELKEGLISITAILNKHAAGELWFGVKNNGIAVGLEVTEKTLRDLSQSIASNIEPKIYPQVNQEKYQGKNCIKIAFKGNDVPYFAYGRVYMRVADEDRQLTVKELEHLILAKNQRTERWDSEPSDLTLKDIDLARLKRFLKRADLKWDSAPNALEKLGLLKKQKQLLNAAGLFFGKKQICRLRCAVFGGTTSANIIDQHDIEGDVLELIEEAQKYVLKNIHIGMRVNGLYREDIPEISVEAMREAIINAFCHRDYREQDEVRVAIFKDRVEIRNPGELYDGLTMTAMRKGNVSKRRNPLIADLLRRIHMVETWGRGMKLILEKEPNVEFKETAKIFIASFARPSFDDKQVATKQNTKETPKKQQDDIDLVGGENTEKVRRKYGENAERVLQAIGQNKFVKTVMIAKELQLAQSTVEKIIAKLKKAKVLKRIGPDKGGHWEVVKKVLI